MFHLLLAFILALVSSIYVIHKILEAKKEAEARLKKELLLAEIESNTFHATCPVNKSRLAVVRKEE